ncbi:MAG: Restriction modification system DNA specificity domain protein [candidate division CPR2 bacterium GW2011_GWC1_39_9]|uniref:Restriction modification system DNA specificity domain protein n=1 Tax=candidate division CPR2 bacterium GW2011_GWC2_39_10 TaxID=1618345 RepID=A0A0G0LZ81_UNCC2|nr:MAG: Restriction modification system DNA specificity domain protein [candidate division CPR2 bacterium GW2011_GWC2_39_10]KKR32825.1 MAG: Restriction modification system DNA specificity domain protein [candidate division CPR2 bacterium GW2011_GWC1_39_9]
MKNNWQMRKLSGVCTVIAGQSPEGKFYNNHSDGLPFYQGKKEFTEKFIGVPTVWTTKVTKEANAGDILMSVRAPVGPVNFATEKVCMGRGLAAIRATKMIDKDFLFYFFQHFENKIIGNAGAVFNSISKAQIENIEIPLPTSEEQKRIVAILDKVFADIGKAKENAQKNLQNACDLFESYLNNLFLDLNKGSKPKKLEIVCDIVGGGTPSKDNSVFYSGDIFWATVRDMRDDVILNTECKITPEAVKSSSTNIIPKGNVVIATRVGLGKICFLSQDTAINQDLRGIIPKNLNQLSTYYLFWWFKNIAKVIEENGIGATVKGVKLPFIKNLEIPLPSIHEQKAIVKKLDELSEQTKKLEEIYQQKLDNLEELKKSILKKAFDGEL